MKRIICLILLTLTSSGLAIKCQQCTKDATLSTCESANDNGQVIECPANVKFCETISYKFEGKEYTHRDCAPSSIYYLDGKDEDTCIGTSSYQRKDGSYVNLDKPDVDICACNRDNCNKAVDLGTRKCHQCSSEEKVFECENPDDEGSEVTCDGYCAIISYKYQDKEYAHRGCIGAKLQGEPTKLGCDYNVTDFRRPDGSKIDKTTVCGCKTDLCNESVSDAAESDGMRWCPALINLLFAVVIVLKISKCI